MNKFIMKLLFVCSIVCTARAAFLCSSHIALDEQWVEKVPLNGGGIACPIYKAFDGKKWYVVRDISYKSHEDRMKEIHVQKIASDYQYGPHLYKYDLNKGKIVISFEESVPVQDECKGAQMAQTLKKMHDGPDYCELISITDQIYKRYSATQHFPSEIDKEKLKKVIDSIKGIKPLQVGPAHRDLHSGNVLWTTQGCKLIDFESAARDDQFFDIATVIFFNFECKNFEQDFLQNYFKRDLSLKEQAHLKKMKKVVLLHFGFDLLRSVSSGIINTTTESISFYEAYELLLQGKISLKNEKDRLILAKGLLNLAIKLHYETLS